MIDFKDGASFGYEWVFIASSTSLMQSKVESFRISLATGAKFANEVEAA